NSVFLRDVDLRVRTRFSAFGSPRFSVSGYAVIRPSEEVDTNLTSPLAPRNMPPSLLSRVLNQADDDRQDHFSLSYSGKAGRRWYGSGLQGSRYSPRSLCSAKDPPP